MLYFLLYPSSLSPCGNVTYALWHRTTPSKETEYSKYLSFWKGHIGHKWRSGSEPTWVWDPCICFPTVKENQVLASGNPEAWLQIMLLSLHHLGRQRKGSPQRRWFPWQPQMLLSCSINRNVPPNPPFLSLKAKPIHPRHVSPKEAHPPGKLPGAWKQSFTQGVNKTILKAQPCCIQQTMEGTLKCLYYRWTLGYGQRCAM